MFRKLSRFVLAVVVAATMAFSAGPVLAAGPIGTCSSGSANNYRSGETAALGVGLSGVYGQLYAGTVGFGPCVPDDNSGTNSSNVQIGLTQGVAWSSSFVTMGLIRCNTASSSTPASACDGTLHIYAEQHGALLLDYTMWDLGTATLGTVYSMKIYYGCTGHATDWCWYLGNTLLKNYNMGAGFVPGNTTMGASWQVETSDPGDGLGNNVAGQSSGAGQIEYRKNSDGFWYLRSVGAACDVIHAQHKCNVNGANGFFGYTLN